MKLKFYIAQLVMIGLLVSLAISCKKEDPKIQKKDPIIIWENPVDIGSGTKLSAVQLNATANAMGTFIYKPAIGASLNAGVNQELKVEFTPNDLEVYNIVSKTVKINVLPKKNPVIIWENPADLIFGALLSTTQLNAKTNALGTFIYTPALGAILNVGTNQDLKVEFTPTDLEVYNIVSKTVKINVVPKKDPGIIWLTPKDISFGTKLSTTQLNATAATSGTFIYTPAISTSLNVGANQDLKVEFIPNDIETYSIVSKTVKINVIIISPVFNTAKTYGTMTDQEGNTYKTITIGTQTWMAENLRVTKYRNGDLIPNVPGDAAWMSLNTGAYCSYANSTNKDVIATYGLLYNWYTVADIRNIAPNGWHVPTDEEWTILSTTLGGDSFAGGKLKERGTKKTSEILHWTSPNADATNESGFTALPSGYRSSNDFGMFNLIGDYCDWWSASENGSYNAWVRNLYYGNGNCYRHGWFTKQNGFAVRLIKD